MDPEIIAIIGLSVLLIVWYGAGYLYNRRRGRRLFRWLEKGLHVVGDEREMGWIGSPASGARVNVVHANPPLRRAEITLLLANREIPLLWLLDHLRGRRDRVIIQATLRSPRRVELRVTSDVRRTVAGQDQGWTRQAGPHGLAVSYRGQNAQGQLEALEPWLDTYGAHVHRFYWNKRDPHIVLQMRIAGLLEVPAEEFFTDLSAALKANTRRT